VATGDLVSLFNGAIGAAGVLVIFLGLLISRQIVTKGELDEMRAERDEWRRTAETNEKITVAVLGQVAPAAKDVLSALQQVAMSKASPP
jgi:hypothetical protein